MSPLNIRNQCLFLAIYSLCILLFACIMSSGGPGPADPVGTSESVRFVCTSCAQRNFPGFFSTLRACRIHQGMSKRCKGSSWQKITVMTRPGDVIAGGSGGMGPCPPPQHQPPGIRLTYTWYIPGIYHILGIFHVYTWYIPVIYIQKVYTWYIPGIYLAYDHLCRNPGIYIEKTFWVCSVPVTYPFRHVISQEYPWSITCLYG